jgi:hypothetical protein
VRRPLLLALSLFAAAVLVAGCGGGKTRTETVTKTQTVVQTVTTPSTGTATTPTTSTSTSTPVPTGPRSCGKIDITYPNGEGGSSAVGIVATGLACGQARAVTQACQRGNLTPGWSARRSGSSGILLTSGSRRITFQLAGGGGCLPGP